MSAPASRSAAAARMARYYQRKTRGVRIYGIPLPEQKLLESLVSNGWLSADEAEDQDRVTEVIARIVMRTAKTSYA